MVDEPRTDYTGGSITDLVVLRFGQLNEELCDLVLNLHLAEDRRAVVCDGDVSIGGDKNFVEAWRGQAKTDGRGRRVPRGPSDVRMMLATVLAAKICD